MNDLSSQPTAPAEVCVGHCHLKVSDLERSVAWYERVIGLRLTQRFGKSAAFMAFGGYHHHLGLNTWESLGGPPAPRDTSGLYHVAFRYPDRPALADALQRLKVNDVTLTGAADHGVSEALYLDDPDGNGIELYWDRDPSKWPLDAQGDLAMANDPLNLESLLAERRGQ